MKKVLLLTGLFCAVNGLVWAQEEEKVPEGYGDHENKEVKTTREAAYPDGRRAMYMELFSQMTYSEEAVEKGVDDDLKVSFQVLKDSSVTNVRFLNDVPCGCQESVKKGLESMKFVPAMESGVLVNSEMVINVPVNAR